MTFGKVGDIIGRKRLYIYGIALFVLGSLACGFSVSSLTLILARMVQGVGSAMTMSAGPALITQAFPPRERGKALWPYRLLGCAWSDHRADARRLITEYFSWRWMFFVNVPAGVILLYLFGTRVHGFDNRQKRKLDTLGATLTTLMLTALLMGLTFGNDFGWTSLRTVLLFAAAVVFGATFVAVEKRTAEPMPDLRLFQNREFSIGAAAGWASYAGSMPISVFMPFYLQNLLSFSPEKVGVVLASGPLTLAFVAPIAGALSDRIGSRVLTSAGLLIASIGILSMRSLTPDSGALDVAWRLVLTSFGTGMFVSPNSSSVMGSVKHEDLGIASGTIGLVRNLGMVCGIAFAGAVITTVEKRTLPAGMEASSLHLQHLAFFAGLKSAFFVSAAIALIGSATSAMRVRPANKQGH